VCSAIPPRRKRHLIASSDKRDLQLSLVRSKVSSKDVLDGSFDVLVDAGVFAAYQPHRTAVLNARRLCCLASISLTSTAAVRLGEILDLRWLPIPLFRLLTLAAHFASTCCCQTEYQSSTKEGTSNLSVKVIIGPTVLESASANLTSFTL
jgi:hypothetical protein